MYDPLETDLSYDYLKKIIEDGKGIKIALMGGWAVYLHVNENYRKAFGVDYLKSRDIDLFVSEKDEDEFNNIIQNLCFEKSGYYFRYELIFDRVENKIIKKEKAKGKAIYNLVYIFLDLFSDKKTQKIGSWVIDLLGDVNISKVMGIPVVDISTLLKLKCYSFFEREKLGKELKDACDIYALVQYSGKNIDLTTETIKALEKIMKRDDLCDFIAEHVLKDPVKSGFIKKNLAQKLSTST